MENMPKVEENFDKERAVCNSYDLLVNELGARMAIDAKKYLPVKEEDFDYEDILSWVNAVDFKDGKTPDVGVDIRDSKNESLMKFDARNVEVIKGKDILASNESVLYSMALAEAKMKKIAEVAEDTYPAIAFQIAEIREEYKDVREELLKEDEPKTTLVESFGKVASRRKFLYGTLVVMGIVLVACAAYESTKDVDTGTSTSEPPAVETTEAATPTMEATKTIEPTPTATEVVETEATLVEWDKMELNIGGRPMEFVLGMEKGADLKNKWGMSKMEINDNLADAETKLSTMIGASFWQVYVAQSGEQVTYEDFLLTPEKYKINLMSPDGEDGYKSTVFSFDQIKKFERMFVNENDPRLFFNDPSTRTDAVSGYKLEDDGTFILFETFGNREIEVLDILTSPISTRTELPWVPYRVGNEIGDSIKQELYGIANTPELESSGRLSNHEYKWYDFMFVIDDMGEMTTYEGLSSSVNTEKYFEDNSFWRIEFSDALKTIK